MRAITAKPIHLRKLAAITEVKGRALLSKNFIIMPVFSLGFTFLMNVIYRRAAGGAAGMSAYALALGVLMNISMTGIYCVSAGLAEEKEKNTLRTLMTSSVNGLEFFLGSLIPAVLMTTVVNVLCALIVRFEMSPAQWGGYLAVTTAAAVISSVVGMIFGKESGFRKYDYHSRDPDIYDDSDVFRTERKNRDGIGILVYWNRIRCSGEYLCGKPRRGSERGSCPCG